MNASFRIPSRTPAVATRAWRSVVALTAAALLAMLLALTAASAPAAAVETTPSQDEGGRRQVAETPRDQLGLILYAALGAVAVGGIMTANRQLKGRRPQASGEFRWR